MIILNTLMEVIRYIDPLCSNAYRKLIEFRETPFNKDNSELSFKLTLN